MIDDLPAIASIREFLSGKKTYLAAAVAVIGAVIAWSQGELDVFGLLASIWAALQTVFIRLGVSKQSAGKE